MHGPHAQAREQTKWNGSDGVRFGGGLISSDPAAAADALSSESERNVGSSATAALLIGENEKCAAWEGQRGEATAVVEPVR